MPTSDPDQFSKELQRIFRSRETRQIVIMLALISIINALEVASGSSTPRGVGMSLMAIFESLFTATITLAVLIANVWWLHPWGGGGRSKHVFFGMITREQWTSAEKGLTRVACVLSAVVIVSLLLNSSGRSIGMPTKLQGLLSYGLQIVFLAWAFFRIYGAYRPGVDVYWDLVWICPLLMGIGLFLIALATGHALPGYGLVPLFWSDGVSRVNSLIVASLSSSMMVLTFVVLFLCAYFKMTHRFDEALDGTGGLSLETQIKKHLDALWGRLIEEDQETIAPPEVVKPEGAVVRTFIRWGVGVLVLQERVEKWLIDQWRRWFPLQTPEENTPQAPMKTPGIFVWICIRPLILAIALPALIPILGVSPMPTLTARIGWLLGLSCAIYLFRLLFERLKVVRWLVERTQQWGSDFTRVGSADPRLINGAGMILVTCPILIILLLAHLINHTLPTVTTFTGLSVVGILFFACVVVTGMRKWSRSDRITYVVFWLLVFLPPGLISVAANHFHLYIAAPFAICWVLMAFGCFVTTSTELFRGQIIREDYRLSHRFVRRGIQLGLIAVVIFLLYLNGWSERGGQGVGGVISRRLADFDDWYTRHCVKSSVEGDNYVFVGDEKNQFGSEEIWSNRDDKVLQRWLNTSPQDSDEAIETGYWRVAASKQQAEKQKAEKQQAEWIKDSSRKPKLVIVAVSGGGLRAAVWAEKVLFEIADEIDEFADRTRLISGSSGGMLGAALFVSSLTPDDGSDKNITQIDPCLADWTEVNDRRKERPELSLTDARVEEDLHKDYLTPVIHRLVFGDLFSPLTRHVPGLQRVDRGLVLENVLRSASKPEPGNRLTTTFKALSEKGESKGRLPSLVFTPTIVENSRRLVISNLDLGPLFLNNGFFDPLTGRESYVAGVDFPSYSCSGIPLFHLFPDLDCSLDLASAVRLNATFPYVTPAEALSTDLSHRIVDAGYYDNYGIDFAASWLEQHRRWLEVNTSGVVLIQIRAFSNEAELKQIAPHEDQVASDSGLRSFLDNTVKGTEFFTTPVESMGTARMKVNYYHNDAAVEKLKRSFTFDMLERLTGITPRRPEQQCFSPEEETQLTENYRDSNNFFRVFTFTCHNPESEGGRSAQAETLSWYLSKSEFEGILKNWNTIDNYRRFQYLRGVFRRYFEVDDEANDKEAEEDWRKCEIKNTIDDKHAMPTHRGKSFKAWRSKDAPNGKVEEVTWKFEKLPRAKYKISINLPRPSDVLKFRESKRIGTLAKEFTYVLECPELANFAGKNATKKFHCLSKWVMSKHPNADIGDANPLLNSSESDDDPSKSNRLRLIEEADPNGSLGIWFYLDDPNIDLTQVDESKGNDVSLTVKLSAKGANGYVIADAVRLERVP